MLDTKAKDGYGVYDDNFLMLCMQAKGFVPDQRLTSTQGTKCEKDSDMLEEAACYREDSIFAKWAVDRSQKSN